MPRPDSISLEEYRRLVGLPTSEQVDDQDRQSGGRSKYGNRRVFYESPLIGGRYYDSVREAKVAESLDRQWSAGGIRYWLPQVPLPLRARSDARQRTMRVDFMVVTDEGKVRWIDAKGFVTPEWSLKRDLVREQYGIWIETV